MLSPKLKWPQKAICIPSPNQRTRSAHIKLNKQADLFLIQNANILFFCIQLLSVWSGLDILTWIKRELEEKYIICRINYCI